VTQRSAGLQLVLADGGDDGLALGDQVDDAVVDFIQPSAQLEQFVGSQVAVRTHVAGTSRDLTVPS
jgi:hypothetical protein